MQDIKPQAKAKAITYGQQQFRDYVRGGLIAIIVLPVVWLAVCMFLVAVGK